VRTRLASTALAARMGHAIAAHQLTVGFENHHDLHNLSNTNEQILTGGHDANPWPPVLLVPLEPAGFPLGVDALEDDPFLPGADHA
jgi:hypothetical protein